VAEALAHPWLAQLHDEAAEPQAPGEHPRRGPAARRGSSAAGARCAPAEPPAVPSGLLRCLPWVP
jgi:hypothetical protein